MPLPRVGEPRNAYINRCVPIVMKEGTAKNQAQAVAICASMYRNPLTAMSLSRDSDKAQLLINDVAEIERLGIRQSREILVKLRQQVLQSYRSGKSFSADTFVKDLHPILTKSAALAHVAGRKRSRVAAKQAGADIQLQLDLLDDVAKLLKKTVNYSLNKVKKTYSAVSLTALKNLAAPVEEKIRETIGNLISEGSLLKDAIETLDTTLNRLGVGAVEENKLEAIYRTQLQTSFNAGRWQEDQSEEIQEILYGYKYVTAGDDRVREEHAALDGVTLPKDDPFWLEYWPPNGWGCRCQVIPIFEERENVQPQLLEDGSMPRPDEGFEFNPGIILKGLE